MIPWQYLVSVLHRQVEGALSSQVEKMIRMQWVLGHVGVLGNEWADIEEKAAAERHSSEGWFIPIKCRGAMPISRAAEIQWCRFVY